MEDQSRPAADGALPITPEEAAAAAKQKLERIRELLRHAEECQRMALRCRELAAETEAKLRAYGGKPHDFD